MSTTDEYVERAARAVLQHEIVELDKPDDGSEVMTPDEYAETCRGYARAVLDAVLPDVIREARAAALRDFANEIENPEWDDGDWDWQNNPVGCIIDAARARAEQEATR